MDNYSDADLAADAEATQYYFDKLLDERDVEIARLKEDKRMLLKAIDKLKSERKSLHELIGITDERIQLLERRIEFIYEKLTTSLNSYTNKILKQAMEIK